MKRVSASHHPHATLHQHLKLPTDGAGDDESLRAIRDFIYTLSRENLFVSQMNNLFQSYYRV